ncbi:response regulator transcription factor [Thiotrichales bacterium 19X7-9]|nr:response regulator transcription factor [Thiotrichales bacterium 19X7-9]TNF66280.1 MAG: response regulator transcription factor [Gammaproteobacteria bacterium]UTW42381.1 response regulator transcription factor [bacterium SCSIO 12844]
MTKTQVLIVDDDQSIGELLSEFLEKFHYQVTIAKDGISMKKLIKEKIFDIILLDIMLPHINGFELCQFLRQEYSIPIIIISALDDDSDRILGLEVGADDYLPKPFNTRELLARMKALLRRSSGQLVQTKVQGHIIEFDQWRLDHHRHVLINQQDIVISLSSKEYRLLDVFLTHPNQILSRNQIMEKLYGRDFDPMDRSVDVLIGRLRKKIETDYKAPKLLKTVRGEGYQLVTKPKVLTSLD